MASVVGNKKKERSRIAGFLFLLGASLSVAIIATAAFWAADEYHVNPAWLFGAGAAALFFTVVGWGYRNKFRSPAFLTFFAAWLLVHVAIYLLVLSYLGLLYYVPIAVVELWIGYALAIWHFGPPLDRGSH